VISMPWFDSLRIPSLFGSIHCKEQQIQRRHRVVCIVLLIGLCAAPLLGFAQDSTLAIGSSIAPRNLITQPVEESQRTLLRGNVHPLARPAFDRGAATASLPMRRMILVLKRSPEQESSLRALLDAQQTKGSPSFHQWLTPEQFGKQFGASDNDVETVKAWLESHGFQTSGVSKGRTTIEFSGTAGQVQEAFHTAIHSFVVNGEQHWANVNDPSIPSALAPAVNGILSLHNFPRQPHSTVNGNKVRATQNPPASSPLFTFTPGTNTYYGLGPTDFATIYNVLPLWNAGIDGSGQIIAIVGETNIHVSDVENFRSLFGLPAKDPQIILNGPDPGVVGDESEALLDVSWSGAVARSATIDLVVSATTESSLGVDLSALYIVDNNLAPVLSESYGECESTLGNSGNAFYNEVWQQAAAQGITVVVSAGDAGSAGCDDFNSEEFAFYGLAVSGFASTPYNVSVGGTDFDQTPATASKYWSATNNATTGASALSYIPETTWNDSCEGFGTGECTTSSNFLDIVAGSGGPSSCSTLDGNGNCIAGYGKPSWQIGPGVPTDGVRDQPDVSLFASDGFNGSFYIICEADAGFFGSPTACSLTNDSFLAIGGTSASAPTFAGILALVNQSTTTQGSSSRLGNANYVLYNLAAQNGASCNSSTAAVTGNSCIFYDITKGNDSVPCWFNTPNCGTAPANGYGVLTDPNNSANPAWNTTAGYDLATGLGSVNAANLVKAWNAATFGGSTTTLTNLAPVSITHGQTVNVSATVAAQSGTGTPTGSVALIASPAGQSLGIQSFALLNGSANGTTTLLPGGTYNVTAHYPGDGTFAASDSAPVQVTVGKENSQTVESTMIYPSATGGFYSSNTVPYGSIFFLRSDVTNAAGAECSPNPVETSVQCPTGNVSFTDGGKPLDAGTYALNSEGYTEDQALASEFSALGSYTLQAKYSGDTSYNPSSNSLTANVVQAQTFPEIGIPDLSPYIVNGVEGSLAWSGQAFHVIAPVYTQSILQAPTGTISILENGTAASGTIAYTASNGIFIPSSGAYQIAYLSGSLPLTIDTPGTYTFSASYNGDANYLASQAPYSVPVTVVDTTFQINTPIPNVTIAAPGQPGVAQVALTGVDNFAGQVTLVCTLPSTMTEATCPTVTTNLTTSATAQVTITTTAPHASPATRASTKYLYGIGALACVFLFALPGKRRRNFPIAMLCLVFLAGFAGCGGGGSNSGGGTITDPGTAAGTYTVAVTATSSGITRTANFTVTVQ